MCILWIPEIPIQDSFLWSISGKIQPEMYSGPSYDPRRTVLQNTVSEYWCFEN